MKIAVYDIQHDETLKTVIQVFSHVPLHVFTSPAFAKKLQNKFHSENLTWHILPDDAPLKHAGLIRKQNQLHCFTHIILSTVYQHHLLFGRLATSKTKLLVILHEAGELQPKLDWLPRSIIRFAGMNLLNKKAAAFFVLSSEVKDHIQENKLTTKPVIILPGAISEETATPPASGNFVICIPGTATSSRRDYEEIVRVAPLLEPGSRNIEFVVLGASPDRNYIPAISYAVDQLNKPVSVRYFDSVEPVGQEEFDNSLRSCHVVYLPLLSASKKEGCTEYYGRTKVSGGFFDAVRFSRIILQPAYVPVAAELAEQTYTYSSVNELARWINTAVNDQKFLRSAQEKANINVRRFQLETVRQTAMTELNAL